MKVLHVLEAVEGGTARHVVDVVEWTSGVEHIVAMPSTRRVGVTATDAAGAIEAAGGRLITTDMHRRPTSVVNARATLRVRRLIRRERPDVVHTHSSIGGVVGRLATIGTGVPALYTPNGLAPGRLATTIERALGRRTAAFVAVSESEADDVRDRKLVAPERLVVIPNGVAVPGPPAADLRHVLGVPPATPLVGFVGRLAWQKAPEVFLDMAERVGAARSDLHVVVIGDGPLRDTLEARLTAGPLGPRLHWLPYLAATARYLGDLDVLALPSRFEGAPYVPLEAMRAGVVVVLSACTGNRDLVDDGVNGRLVPVDDAPALTRAVEDLLADPSARAALAAAGKRAVAERFTLDRIGARLAELYAVVARTGRPASRDIVS